MTRKLSKLLIGIGVVALVATGSTNTAQATAISFDGTGVGPGGAPLAAHADFTVNVAGTEMTIVLRNTAGNNTFQDVPGSTLSGIYFNYTGGTVLTPFSAILTAGSSIIQHTNCNAGANCDTATNVGGEFGYEDNAANAGNLPRYGIASSGYLSTGIPGNIGNFNNGLAGTNLDDPNSLDGINFGIVSAIGGYAPNGGLASVPLIVDLVTFKLTGTDLLESAITDVVFTYGTSFSEDRISGCLPGRPCAPPPPCTGPQCAPPPKLPEPGTLLMFAFGLLGMAFIRRRIVCRI